MAEITDKSKEDITEKGKKEEKTEQTTETEQVVKVEPEVKTSIQTPVKAANKQTVNPLGIDLKFDNYKDFLEFCQILSADNANGKLTPLKSKGDVAIALLMGADLGLSIPVALNNIVPINGKATLSNNLQMGILATHGIITEILKDAEPIYAVYHYDYDDKGNIKKVKKGSGADAKEVLSVLEIEYKFRDECEKLVEEYNRLAESGELDEVEKLTEKPKIRWKPVGRGTRVRLERKVKQPDGSFKTASITRQFTTMDADNIQFFDATSGKYKSVRETKDAWKNYEPDMLYANAFRRCAKIIANDLLMNLYSTEEMLDTTNINYSRTEEGEVTILDKDGKTLKKV